MEDSILSDGESFFLPEESALLIRDLCLRVRLGVGAEERAKLQRLQISIDVIVRPARAHDNDVTTVVDYGAIVARVRCLAGRETQLLETWVQWIAQACFLDSRVAAASITLIKPDVFPDSVQVGIRQRITRPQ